MRPRNRIVLPSALLVMALFPVASHAQPDSPPIESAPAINMDAAAPTWSKEWVGTYYTHSPMKHGARFVLGPDDLKIESRPSLKKYEAEYVRDISKWSDGVLMLGGGDPVPSRMVEIVFHRLYLVRWGDRRYAVPDSQIASFVEQVRTRAGSITKVTDTRPADTAEGGRLDPFESNVGPLLDDTLVHGEDVLKPAFGQPEVPGGWAAFLHHEPVFARITRVVAAENAADVSTPNATSSFDVTINAGSDTLVFVGQELFWREVLGHVVSVDAQSSVVRFVMPSESARSRIGPLTVPSIDEPVAALASASRMNAPGGNGD